MSSEDFHRNQYEQGRNGGKSEEQNQKEKVYSGMRAVLQQYISREEAGTGAGMGKFDTLTHDRMTMWRNYERNKKMRKFTYYFIFSLLIAPLLLMFGFFNTWLSVALSAIVMFVFSFLIQYSKKIYIQGHAATDTLDSRLGVKRAISDIWFETLFSVKLSYLWGVFLLFAWWLLGYLFGDYLEPFIVMYVNLIIGFFDVQITHVAAYYFFTLIFVINISSLLGDFLFWKIFYSREKISYGER